MSENERIPLPWHDAEYLHACRKADVPIGGNGSRDVNLNTADGVDHFGKLVHLQGHIMIRMDAEIVEQQLGKYSGSDGVLFNRRTRSGSKTVVES